MMERIADTIRFVVLPNWKLALLFVGVILVGLLVASMVRDRTSGPTVTIQGRIERFGFSAGSRDLTPRPIAIVRIADGTTSAVAFDRRQLAACRAGDRITYTRGPEGVTIDRCVP